MRRDEEGGDNNLMTIQLRNLNYTSINYDGYLQLGRNNIDIVITLDKLNAGAGYVLRVTSIGESDDKKSPRTRAESIFLEKNSGDVVTVLSCTKEIN